MRNVPKALRSSARLRIKKVEAQRYVPKQKFSIDWKFPVEFIAAPNCRAVTALRNSKGVWEARNAEGRTVAYFGDEFAKAIAREIRAKYPHGLGGTPEDSSDAIRRKRILRSFLDGSIKPQKKAELRTRD